MERSEDNEEEPSLVQKESDVIAKSKGRPTTEETKVSSNVYALNLYRSFLTVLVKLTYTCVVNNKEIRYSTITFL